MRVIDLIFLDAIKMNAASNRASTAAFATTATAAAAGDGTSAINANAFLDNLPPGIVKIYKSNTVLQGEDATNPKEPYPVVSLQADDVKIVAAYSDGSLVAWDKESGGSIFLDQLSCHTIIVLLIPVF